MNIYICGFASERPHNRAMRCARTIWEANYKFASHIVRKEELAKFEQRWQTAKF